MVEGINKEKLSDWMRQSGLVSTDQIELTPLSGGTQNILVRITADSGAFVLRRPAVNLRPNSNSTMAREARMLAALDGSGVPHPEFVAVCEDERVLGCVFYLMAPVDGFNPVAGLPKLHAESADMRHEMGLSFVRAIARLGELSPETLGVEDMGKPQNYLSRQVSRWKQQLKSYEDFEAWDGRADLPGIDRIGDWLDAHCPQETKPGILHGDAHFGNTMFSYDKPDLKALVDWELTTIGDPLVDLGWLLATWPESAENFGAGAVGVSPWEGFPDAAQVVRSYAESTTRDVSAAEWYGVLGCYKLGIIQEGTYARACAGKVPKAVGDHLHERTIWLLERALQWIS